MAALYDVYFRRPDQAPKRIAIVKAVRQVGPAGNWFPKAQEIMTPDKNAILDALPYRLRMPFLRDPPIMWHTEGTLYAGCSILGSRGQVLGVVTCQGYERE